MFWCDRGGYRTAELANGWNGRIIATQVYFSAYTYPFLYSPFIVPDDLALDVLDGAMVVLSTFTLNFLHPAWLLYHGPYSRRNPSIQPQIA